MTAKTKTFKEPAQAPRSKSVKGTVHKGKPQAGEGVKKKVSTFSAEKRRSNGLPNSKMIKVELAMMTMEAKVFLGLMYRNTARKILRLAQENAAIANKTTITQDFVLLAHSDLLKGIKSLQ